MAAGAGAATGSAVAGGTTVDVWVKFEDDAVIAVTVVPVETDEIVKVGHLRGAAKKALEPLDARATQLIFTRADGTVLESREVLATLRREGVGVFDSPILIRLPSAARAHRLAFAMAAGAGAATASAVAGTTVEVWVKFADDEAIPVTVVPVETDEIVKVGHLRGAAKKALEPLDARATQLIFTRADGTVLESREVLATLRREGVGVFDSPILIRLPSAAGESAV